MSEELKPARVDIASLPELWPTEQYSPEFWEWLGRCVAAYGLLEKVLAQAFFAVSGTTPVSSEEAARQLEEWREQLQKSLSDTLSPLINRLAAAIDANQSVIPQNPNDLINALREAARLRNVLCHGAWGKPKKCNTGIPWYFNRKSERFDEEINVEYLRQVHTHVRELICGVINIVTTMGYQFPGGYGPGKPVW